MSDDEQAIRRVVADWMTATRAGAADAVLELMTDDVVFMVPGQPPFGKREFALAFAGLRGARLEGHNEIVELRVLGDWAFVRNRIEMTVTPAGGAAVHRSGHTLTLLRREADGAWRLARDANLMVTD